MSGYKVAVVGATGAVGRAMVAILEERRFPVSELRLLASERSAGEAIQFRGRPVTVENLAEADFSGVQIGLFSAGASVSKVHAPRAAAAGCVVIDNTSQFRYDEDIPLVVSEVNPEALSRLKPRNIIANPNCSTMQLMVALAPLHRAAGIERLNIATYQSVSGAGQSGIDELMAQSRAVLAGQSVTPEVFGDQIAFNVVPHIDAFQDNGYTREEMKLVWETRRILNDPEIGVNATAVRVPSVYGHAEAVHLETRRPLAIDAARELLAQAPGVEMIDQPRAGGYPTPATHGSGSDAVFVGRLRRDLSHPRGISLWVVADNVRKGAALNTVQLAELLVKSHL